MKTLSLQTADAQLSSRARWVLERRAVHGPAAPPAPWLSGVCRAAFAHAGNLAALVAGAAMLVLASPVIIGLSVAASAAGAVRRSRERDLSFNLPSLGPGWKTTPPAPGLGSPASVRPRAVTDNLYFSLRVVSSEGGRQVMQYAFVDDHGTVVFSAFGYCEGPPPALAVMAPEDLAAEPVEAEALDYLLSRICAGSTLIAFGRVLQGGLLPPGARDSAQTVDCAWRRFIRVARRRGLVVDRTRPLALNDALEIAGLPAVEGQDAAMRARGIRDLWSWMDQMEAVFGDA